MLTGACREVAADCEALIALPATWVDTGPGASESTTSDLTSLDVFRRHDNTLEGGLLLAAKAPIADTEVDTFQA